VEQFVDAFLLTYGCMWNGDMEIFLIHSKEELVSHFLNQHTIMKDYRLDTTSTEWFLTVQCVKNDHIVHFNERAVSFNFRGYGTAEQANDVLALQEKIDDLPNIRKPGGKPVGKPNENDQQFFIIKHYYWLPLRNPKTGECNNCGDEDCNGEECGELWLSNNRWSRD